MKINPRYENACLIALDNYSPVTVTNITKNGHLEPLSDHITNISLDIPQSLPHEYPPQPAYQLCSADTQDQNANP